MKNKILFSFTGVLVVFALIAVWVSSVNAIKQSKDDLSLTLRATSEKQAYVLGELVKLNFESLNEGNMVIKVPYKPDVSTGYLKIFIAFDGKEFNQYNNSSWGRMEKAGPTLQPGQSYNSQVTLLWNSKPETSHLNVDAAKRATTGKIQTDYAFPKAGVYSIKAVTTIPGDAPVMIESEPIQIIVNEPAGDDLKIWSRIKNNGDFAYFIQQGGTPTYQDEKAENLLKEIEQISENYPNSFLAGQLKQKLEKFRVDEEKRRNMLEKARIKPNN